MKNIPQVIQQLSYLLAVFGFLSIVPPVCPCAFTGTNSCSGRAGWWRICQVAPPYLENGGFYRLFVLALQHCPTATCKQRYLLYMNAQASINAGKNHQIYISLCWHVSLIQYDIVLPQPKQLTELDKDSNRRQAVLHRKVFDGKYKSTALSNHSLNMLEKWQIVKIKCHVLHMKTKQTWWKLLAIGIGLV